MPLRCVHVTLRNYVEIDCTPLVNRSNPTIDLDFANLNYYMASKIAPRNVSCA